VVAPLKTVIRLATEDDLKHEKENREKEKEAFKICQEKIAANNLEMKLVRSEIGFDNNKILFYFTANGRVDFRALVKDLAAVFKTRIELRQIGVRDEAKMLGGLGPCGRPICCGSFLSQFQPVSIKMAKEQNLSLNPTKISGVCGRLMCCLKYEQDHYEQTRKRMPKVGRTVNTPDGSGPVTELNIIRETVFVRLTNGDTSEIKEYPLESITRTVENPQPEKNASNHENTEKAKKGNSASGTPDKSEKTESSSSKEENRNQNKNKNRARNQQLGQPVKRENPNRENTKVSKNEKEENRSTEAEDRKMNETTSEKAETAPKATSSAWADAVQNAMRAIDKE
jgi:cell fate regulator YaaT (PSP1 superfamily)